MRTTSAIVSRIAPVFAREAPVRQLSSMASWDELPLKYRFSIRAYRWRTVAGAPWATLRVKLTEARVALVTSAGLYRLGVDADFGTREGEDLSARYLPSDTAINALAIGQTSDAFDRGAIIKDKNLALPLDRLHELAAAGEIGAVAPRAVSFNGSLLAPGRFIKQTAPGIVDALRVDEVDAALFVPV